MNEGERVSRTSIWTRLAAAAVAACRSPRRRCRRGRRTPTAESSDKSVLRIGWGQDPQTLNPFVGLDEEDFTIWAIS